MSSLSLASLGTIISVGNSVLTLLVVKNEDVETVREKWLSLNNLVNGLTKCDVGSSKYTKDRLDIVVEKKDHYLEVEALYLKLGLVQDETEFFKLQLKLLKEDEPSCLLNINVKFVEEGKSIKVVEGQTVLNLFLDNNLKTDESCKLLDDVINQLKYYKQ